MTKKHHLLNGSFRNNSELKNIQSNLTDVVRWKAQAPRVKKQCFPIKADCSNKFELSSSCAAWLGHATFLIKHQGLTIITDPHLSLRASPLPFAGPKRYTSPALKVQQLPDIDVVVISHDHYDHLDLTTVKGIYAKQKSNPPIFLVPLGIGKWLSRQGIHHWIELDWWQSTILGGWSFSAVPVQHFSGRGLTQNNTLWAGWVIRTAMDDRGNSKQLFFAGDTGYSDDFREINKRFGEFDFAMLPIGAYAPRWFMKEMHVNPEEAVKIHLDIQSRYSVAMHWGSFILTDEPLDEPPKQLDVARDKMGLRSDEFVVVEHGEVFDMFKNSDANATNEELKYG